MNGHCGITGSTYRPVERDTYVARMESTEGSPFRGLFFALLITAVPVLGALLGWILAGGKL